jgi:hypothetical protein
LGMGDILIVFKSLFGRFFLKDFFFFFLVIIICISL